MGKRKGEEQPKAIIQHLDDGNPSDKALLKKGKEKKEEDNFPTVLMLQMEGFGCI